MNDLHDGLRRAADQNEPPLRTDPHTLLERAQRHRRRSRNTRLGGVAAGVAALSVGAAAFLPGILNTADDQPAGDRLQVATAPSGSASAVLSEQDVLARCQSQIEATNDFYGDAAPELGKLTVAHPGQYRVGDVVALTEEGAGTAKPSGEAEPTKGGSATVSVLCGLTEDGEDPAAIVDPSPSDTAHLRQRCEQQQGGTSEKPADLDDATVVDTVEVDGNKLALLGAGGTYYQCTWAASPSDNGFAATGTAGAVGDVNYAGFVAGSAGKSLTPGSGSYTYGSGVTDPAAASIVLTSTEGGAEVTVPVTDGRYAFIEHDPDADSLIAYDWEVRAADGTVLDHFETPKNDPNGPK